MDRETLTLAVDLVPKSYITQAESALTARRKLVKTLLSQRSMPVQGWDETSIEYLLQVSLYISPLSSPQADMSIANAIELSLMMMLLVSVGGSHDGQQQLLGQCGCG